MSIVACAVDDCENPKYCKGVCVKHYARLRRTGSVEKRQFPSTCTVEGCDRPYLAKGLCKLHRDRLQSNGTLETIRFSERPCSVDGCDKPHKARGWCDMHYRRWRLKGEAGQAKPMLMKRPVVDGMRQCSGCEEWVAVENFTKGSHPGTLHHHCRPCARLAYLEWRKRRPTYYSDWQKANPEKVIAIAHKRRAQKLSLPHENIDRRVVFERSDFTCALCNEPLDMDAKFPHPKSPTIDHIIPLNLGGPHLYENTQAAHFYCNTAKGDRLVG